LYRLWSSGGAVWLKEDPGKDNNNHSGNGEDNGRSSEPAVDVIDGKSAVQTVNEECTNKKYVNSIISSGETEHTDSPIQGDDDTSSCVCEIQPSACNDTGQESYSPIQKQVSQHPAIAPGGVSDTDHIVPQIRATDYKVLDQVEHRAHCYGCGRKGVHFIEKLTSGRKARANKNALRICKVCYKAAVRRDQAVIPILPGAIVATRMQPTGRQIGRCTLCHLEVAKWTDPGSQVHLCDYCHSRVVLEDATQPAFTEEGKI
jgi:hypothetical protein